MPLRHLCQSSILLGLHLSLFVSDAIAQTDEFEQWQASQNAEFQNYQTEFDKEFVQFLEAEWEAFRVFTGEIRDDSPKPAEVPVIHHDLAVAQASEQSINRVSAPEQISIPGFFGHQLSSPKLPDIAWPDLSVLNSSRVSQTWQAISSQDNQPILDFIKEARAQLDLDDWGTIQLAEKYLTQRHLSSRQKTIYSWFLLNKLGYDARVGYTKGQTLLMLPAKYKVYSRRFNVIGDTRYYLFPDIPVASVTTYSDKQYQPQSKPLEFSFQRAITASGINASIRYQLHAPYPEKTIELDYDPGTTDFLRTYPQVDLQWYFRARPSAPTANSLKKELQPLIAGKSDRDAINALLHFTQSVFDYQTDEQQFGREEYLLIEESLYFGINDCEDRSIFLAWLLRNLLQKDVVILDYPGHVALAVATDIQPSDQFVTMKGRKYVIADPTYIGANLGVAMPQFAHLEPEVIAIPSE